MTAWEKCVAFHGHSCGGLTIGYKAALYAMDLLDIEFADNNPLASNCEITIHIFTKAIEGYATTSEIAGIIYELMKENYFICSSNSEIPAEGDDVRHRVMVFRNNLF